MRYKEQTISKIDAQAMKLESLIRSLELHNVTAQATVDIVKGVIKELRIVAERLELEPNN